MNNFEIKKSNNNFEKNFDDLFKKIMDELKEDFSLNFISNFGENEKESLSKRFEQVCLGFLYMKLEIFVEKFRNFQFF